MLKYKKDLLFFDGFSLCEIAKKAGTPLYLYSSKKLVENYGEFDGAFSGIKHIVCYAVKANGSPYLLKILMRRGCGCDIVSGGELKLALSSGANPKKIVFAGVGKRDDEIRMAILSGILMFNVESISELYRIDKIAKSLNKTAGISFRVNPDIDARTHPHITTGLAHNKFGLCFEEAFAGYILAKALKSVRIIGIHTHIGSQIVDSGSFVLAAGKVSKYISKLKAAGIVLKYIDMGGGLGIRYENEKVISASNYAKAIMAHLPKDHTLILEPGRFIAGDAGIMVTKILYVKKTPRKSFLVVDAGMNDLVRPAIYGAYHKIIPAIKRSGAEREWDIVGPICESSDIFATDRRLPPVREGDFLAVLCAGAYGYSMSSNYNQRPRPAEAIIENKRWKIIRCREKL